MDLRRPLQRWRRRLGDNRGVAAIEFALVISLLMLMYLGGFEVSQAAATYRKVTDTTVEIANIVAQYTTMSSSDVQGVLGSSTQIMAPYSTSQLTIVLSEITTDVNSNARVTWSQAYNGGVPLTVGASATLPSGIIAPSTSYILVTTNYTYVPTVGAVFIGNIPMTDQIYMLPRQSASIPYTG